MKGDQGGSASLPPAAEFFYNPRTGKRYIAPEFDTSLTREIFAHFLDARKETGKNLKAVVQLARENKLDVNGFIVRFFGRFGRVDPLLQQLRTLIIRCADPLARGAAEASGEGFRLTIELTQWTRKRDNKKHPSAEIPHPEALEPRPLLPDPLILEEARQELDALLAELNDIPAHYERRLQKSLDQVGEDHPAIAGKVRAVRRAIQVLTGRKADPPGPLVHHAPEPSVDLSKSVPEQIAQLCYWLPSQLAEVEAPIQSERDRRRQPIIDSFQMQINSLVGRSFGPTGNATIIKDLREALKDSKLCILCECGFPGLPYYQLAERSNARDGAFQIIHYYKGGQTYHGGPATFPFYTIVPAPPSLPKERPPAPSRKRSR